MKTTLTARETVHRPEAPTTMVVRTGTLRPHRDLTLLLGVVGVVGVLIIWQLSVTFHIVDSNFTSSPLGALVALVRLSTDGELWRPLGSTLSTIAIGLAIAIVISIPLGLLFGRNHILYGLTDQMISIMYAVPYAVFLPMIIFWFGIGAPARVVIVVWAASFPLLINVITGARNLDANYTQVAKVFCTSKPMTMWAVALPATMPFILSGVRQAVGRGLVGAIVAELFVGSSGLGYLVQLKTSSFQMDAAMATVGVIAVIAILLTRGIAALEKHLTFWSAVD